eukprot:6480877-Amphidinium_carterae.1
MSGQEEVERQPTATTTAAATAASPRPETPSSLPAAATSQTEAQEVLVLRNKVFKKGSKGKEIDARWLDDTEWEAFRQSDRENWDAHIKTGAFRPLTAAEAAEVDPSDIIKLPMRYVRVNKDKTNQTLLAKSRLVLPGHAIEGDPDLRVDAPVASQLSLYLLLSTVVNRDWDFGVFDISNAFLMGQRVQRKLICRIPKEGIPGIAPNTLVSIEKGAFGLPESPRLWWLEFSSHIVSCGFIPLREAPAVFIYRNKSLVWIGMLVLHVDDGGWGGDKDDPEWIEAKKRVVDKYPVKQQDGKEKAYTILGRRVRFFNDEVRIDSFTYIDNMKPVYVSKEQRSSPDDVLSPKYR